MKLHPKKIFFLTLVFLLFMCSPSNAANPAISGKQGMNIKDIVQLIAVTTGIVGGLFGLYKYRSDERAKNVREWQKVVIYNCFQESQSEEISLPDIVRYCQGKSVEFPDFDLKKVDLNRNYITRVLLELSSSNILVLSGDNSFKLKIERDFIQQEKILYREINEMINASPNAFSIEYVAKSISNKYPDFQIYEVRNYIQRGIELGAILVDENKNLSLNLEAAIKGTYAADGGKGGQNRKG